MKNIEDIVSIIIKVSNVIKESRELNGKDFELTKDELILKVLNSLDDELDVNLESGRWSHMKFNESGAQLSLFDASEYEE